MPTLYVENVPQALYDALRQRARENRKSISAEVLALLEDNVPTAQELARRGDLLKLARRIRARPAISGSPQASSEQSQREDRLR
jgi:plasmid stability protein